MCADQEEEKKKKFETDADVDIRKINEWVSDNACEKRKKNE